MRNRRWAIAMGVSVFEAAVRLRKIDRRERIPALFGVPSILLEVALFVLPGVGALGRIWVIGTRASACRILVVALGIRLKTLKRDI